MRLVHLAKLQAFPLLHPRTNIKQIPRIPSVTVDWTNWPTAGPPAGDTDVTILRPTEVLFDEWAALRANGVPTPSISVWPCSPASGDTWKWALEHLYLNASRAPLIWHDPVDGLPVMFIPATSSCYDEGVVAQVRRPSVLVCTLHTPITAL